MQSTELCGGLGPQHKDTPLHNAAASGHNGAVQLLLTAKANPNAEGRVSNSSSVMWWNCAEYWSVVDWGHRTSGPRYTMLLPGDTMRQCNYCSLRRPMLMLRTQSVTRPLQCDGIVQCSELCVDAAGIEDPATACPTTWSLRLRGAVEIVHPTLLCGGSVLQRHAVTSKLNRAVFRTALTRSISNQARCRSINQNF